VEPTGLEAAVIGPITAETARALGFEVVVQPGRYVVEALADAIVEHLGRRKVG
jgi:uroporphyrinogen-III synthase